MASAALQMFFGGVIVTIAGFAIGEGAALRAHAAHARRARVPDDLRLDHRVQRVRLRARAYAHDHTSLYAYVNPIVAMFLGWLVLSEPLTPIVHRAMVVILAGVALVQTSDWKRKRPVAVVVESVKKAA
jgi:hypothetical protein